MPLAKSGASVVGIEGADYLVDRARENARLNRCAENMTFSVADLFDTDEKTVESWGKFDKMPTGSGRETGLMLLSNRYTNRFCLRR